ncbi:MAG: hypothetical protein U0230_11185 [Polyangiales bacterium]
MQGVELLGVFVHSFARACVNLQILGTAEIDALLAVPPESWVPGERFASTLEAIAARFENPAPILERVGEEMMALWYDHGPGRGLVNGGVEFLRFQTGSQGYRSVVRGPEEALGAFSLEHLDEAAGRARVRSTTPFDRTMERGVLIGGMKLAGDLVYVDVDNSGDPSVYEIRFH